MANLVRHNDPFELFDDIFRRVFRPMMFEATRAMRDNGEMQEIAIDVAENDNAYRIWADLPGVKKDDISVSIEGNRLSLSAEAKREKTVDAEQERLILNERGYGSRYRDLQLTHEVDQQAAQAKYENGVLELTLPKKETSRIKRLEVH